MFSFEDRRSPLQIILWTVGAVLLLYLVYVGYFYVVQRSMIFPRHFAPAASDPPPPVSGRQILWLPLNDPLNDYEVEAWLLSPLTEPSSPAPLAVVGHGNAEIIDLWPQAVRPLREMGFAVLLVEYPGYGRSGGSPSETAITAAFVKAYDDVTGRSEIDANRVLLFGRSVGAAAVTALAMQRSSSALVLLSTFTSVGDMAAAMGLPGFLARDPFDVRAAVTDYQKPVLILHGRHDSIIPYAHAEKLHAAAPNSGLMPLDCNHNDCVPDWHAFWQDVRPFLLEAGIIHGD